MIEFDVKMTSGKLYDFLIYNAYSSASGLIGSCVGAFMLIFSNGNKLILIGGLFILLYTPFTLYTKSKQQMLENPAFRTPLHYMIHEEGIRVSQGETELLVEWDKFCKAVSTRKSIIVYTSKVNAWIFPRKDLGEQTIEVIRLLSACLPPGKSKIKY